VNHTPRWFKATAAVISALTVLGGVTGCPRIVISTEPAPVPVPWTPDASARWLWSLGAVSNVDADVYVLDPFQTGSGDVADLHARGRRTLCRLAAGAWEPGRPDAARFDARVLGSPTGAADGSRWLDVRQVGAVAPILTDRVTLCRVKGFDGVVAEQLDAYARPTGFSIQLSDQVGFNRAFASLTRAQGLRVAIAADPMVVAVLARDFDFTAPAPSGS